MNSDKRNLNWCTSAAAVANKLFAIKTETERRRPLSFEAIDLLSWFNPHKTVRAHKVWESLTSSRLYPQRSLMIFIWSKNPSMQVGIFRRIITVWVECLRTKDYSDWISLYLVKLFGSKKIRVAYGLCKIKISYCKERAGV